jgi:Zn-dependent peptidase ImmA (M78 family)/predicted secreted protein
MKLSWATIHLSAYREATRVHRELGINLTERIDPFSALSALGVVVMRRPLRGVAGLYIPSMSPDELAPGAMVNVLHPVSKQRFTAAHELGHHRRDKEAVVDQDTEWLARKGDSMSDRERFAEAFAAWFLMPRELVERGLARLRVRAADIDPALAYRLALELGTSYQATVHHLGDLKRITSTHRRSLLAASPASIKEALGARETGEDLRRDVWQIDPRRDASPVQAVAGDLLVVEMEETPSSGYLWSIAVPDGISLLTDDWRSAEVDEIGGAGVRRFFLRLDEPGASTIRIEKRRPWLGAVADYHHLKVQARHRPQAGIVEPRQLLPAAAVA